ncbi:helix-turn-helix transcriptional regulator [Calothrix sp. CCY 0018]|uniref:helix-turn-helix transcriptional regulator n=1 Tax=Calothrix sp. CCY 0018 TaxID=3103864 RepID=UPI0039C663C4
MTIKISQSDYYQSMGQSYHLSKNSSIDKTDIICQYPQELGKGYYREIQLREGLELAIENNQLHDDLIVECPERQHLLEFTFQISGSSSDKFVYANAGEYYFYGSGIAPHEQCQTSSKHQNLIVNVHVEPELFCCFIGENKSDIQKQLSYLVRNDNQEYYYCSKGKTTAQMQVALQQILQCPYEKITKKIFLESKILELMALLIEQTQQPKLTKTCSQKFNSEDLERLHYAKEILQRGFENPPSLIELAHQVGLNDYKLKLGFREVFQTTVFGYLQDYRMELAKRLLAERTISVQQVARKVGYAHAGYFSAAFKRKYGVNPKLYQKNHILSA